MDEIFSEFPNITYKEWKNKANFDLRGEDFNSTLNYLSLDGINIPSYLSDDKNSETSIRSNKINETKFCKVFYLKDNNTSLNILRKTINEEIESISIHIPKDYPLEQLGSIDNLFNLDIHFYFEQLTEEFVDEIHKFSAKLSENKRIFLNQDFITCFAKSGKLNRPIDFEIEFQKGLMNIGNNIIPYSINSSAYQNAGANIIQQIAYSMALFTEYIELFGEDFINNLHLKIAVGSNYFLEIAKIESLSYLIRDLSSKYYNNNITPIISCESSNRNKSIYDPYNNILRSVSEAMSALLSKVDYLHTFSFDSIYGAPNIKSDRIAINQLRILREEAYFSKTANITDGVYYLDYIKKQYCEKAIEIFKLIEAGGGFLDQLKKGIIQKKVKESSIKEQELFDAGKIKIVGVNCFVNENEGMDQEIRKYPFLKFKKEKTFIPKITERRLTEKIEKERLEKESNQK